MVFSNDFRFSRRYDGEILVHQSVPNGPESFHRVPMTIDSLTILKRRRQRKQLDFEDHEDEIVPLGSGLHRLITSDTRANSHRSVRCQQDEQSEATRTNTMNSLNTSAHIEREVNKSRCPCDDKEKQISIDLDGNSITTK